LPRQINATGCLYSLAKYKVVAQLVLERELLLIHSIENIQTIQLFRGNDARRFEYLSFEEHAEQEGVRAEHERRVVDDLRDLKLVTRDYSVHTRRGRAGGRTHPSCLEIPS
jgi:hypothetical protein